MIYLVYTIHVIVCLFLILVVLLQQGKGADLSVFGGGSTQTAFGARGAATLLHKLTVVSFVLFIVTTMSIAFLQNKGGLRSVVTDEAAQPATTTPAGEPAGTPPEGTGADADATTPPAEAPPTPAPGSAPASGSPDAPAEPPGDAPPQDAPPSTQ